MSDKLHLQVTFDVECPADAMTPTGEWQDAPELAMVIVKAINAKYADSKVGKMDIAKIVQDSVSVPAPLL